MLGESGLFRRRTKAEEDAEMREYELWAFPYGKPQRDKVESLLSALFPMGDMSSHIISFLTAKEIMEKVRSDFDMPGKHKEAILRLRKDLKKYDRLLGGKKNKTVYCALSASEWGIDQSLGYPSAEEIRVMAGKLSAELNNKDK